MDMFSMIANQVKKMTLSLIREADYDKTVKCKVIKSLGDNKYTIQINGREYTAISYRAVSVNSVVYATICRNNYNDIIIL